jgi:hypothetical protein
MPRLSWIVKGPSSNGNERFDIGVLNLESIEFLIHGDFLHIVTFPWHQVVIGINAGKGIGQVRVPTTRDINVAW